MFHLIFEIIRFFKHFKECYTPLILKSKFWKSFPVSICVCVCVFENLLVVQTVLHMFSIRRACQEGGGVGKKEGTVCTVGCGPKQGGIEWRNVTTVCYWSSFDRRCIRID